MKEPPKPRTWADHLTGATIAGRYRLDRLLGHGSSGIVFAGQHTWTERPVAVKLLAVAPGLADESPDATTRRRFMREAKAAASLPHPNVVDVLDMGEHEGLPFLVLELLDGESLAQRVERDRALDPRITLRILAPLMDALHSAHARGMVHRDIKAENVFLHVDDAGREVPKILDFGIVRTAYLVGEAPLTAQGSLLGTTQYMSPEQITGHSVGPATDVWSMGVLAYRMIAGRFPYDGPSPTMVLADIVTKPLPPLGDAAPTAPRGVVRAIEGALQKAPAARHRDMHVFLDAALAAAREVGLDVPDPRDRISRA